MIPPPMPGGSEYYQKNKERTWVFGQGAVCGAWRINVEMRGHDEVRSLEKNLEHNRNGLKYCSSNFLASIKASTGQLTRVPSFLLF